MGNQICVRKLSFLRKRARENGQCYKRNAMLFPDLKAKTDSERREGKGRKNSWNVKNPFFVRRILFCCLDCLERRRKECPFFVQNLDLLLFLIKRKRRMFKRKQ